MSRYPGQNFVIGDLSPNRLKQVAHRLLGGPSPAPTPEVSPGHVTPKDSAENIRQKFAQAELPNNQVGPYIELSGYVPIPEFDGVPVYELYEPPFRGDEKARSLDSEGSHGIYPTERYTLYSSSPPDSFQESDSVKEVDHVES